jgi:uncharacterized protein
MLPPGSKPLDVERLADDGADFDLSVSLADLPRLRSRLPGVEGAVRGRAHFSRESQFAVADLALEGTAQLQCQRCLRTMTLRVGTQARVALIASEADAGRVPEDLEPMLAPGGRCSIADLVEEELMLFLPIVPLHENSSECVPAPGSAPAAGESGEGQSTHKPFERLNELLKRKQ